MKAVVLHEYGAAKNLKLEEMPDPIPADDEVLIRVTAASLNPIDWKMRSGAVQAMFPVEFPTVLGRDFSGIVRAVGPKVTGFAPGDKVFGLAWHTYAELCVVKAADMAHVPEGLDLVEAAALPLVTLTGEQLIRLGTGIAKDQTVLITGASGAVGRAAVWAARAAGAKVIGGVRKKHLEAAADVHAHHLIALDDEDAMAKLGFVDAVADTVGGETGAGLMGKVKQGGVFASVVGKPANAALHPTVRYAQVFAVPDAGRMAHMADEVLHKRLIIPIDSMLALDDAAEAHTRAEKGGIGKLLLLA